MTKNKEEEQRITFSLSPEYRAKLQLLIDWVEASKGVKTSTRLLVESLVDRALDKMETDKSGKKSQLKSQN